MTDFFNFENEGGDFPFYKNNPHLSKFAWVMLFLSIFAGFIFMGIFNNELLGSIFFCSVILIPVLYYLKWDISAIFQKPKLKEVGLAVLLFAGYMIYVLIISYVLDFFSLTGSDVVSQDSITVISMVSLLFSMMGEELLKFIPFMFLLRLFFKYSNNRKASIIVSAFTVMMLFGLLHAPDFKSIVSVLTIQGLGSVFEFYGYIKTKNLLISYLTHLLTDAFLFSLTFLGLG